MILKAYKYRIYPTKEQEVFFAKSFGCVRWVYNWGLARKTELYKIDKRSISIFELSKDMAKLKNMGETKWLKEVNSQALQSSLGYLDIAFTKFFKEKKRYPRFKSKFSKQSFSNPQKTYIDFNKNLIYIPKIEIGIKTVFDRRFQGKIKTSTISKTPSGKYFVSILVEEKGKNPKTKKAKESKTLGLDLGIKNFLTDSNGNKVENPRFLKKKQKLLKRAQRKLSRKKKGSKNREKQKKRVAILHEKVANCRKDFIHKLTTKLVENQDYTSLAIEDLNVINMIEDGKKTKISREIGNVGWGMFREFLTYKCEREGKNLLVIGRFDPSSKLCSCGNLNDSLTLKDREWTCEKCGVIHDRDVLAAQNIKRFAFCQQNTRKNLVGQELSEHSRKTKTPLESDVSYSLKKEVSIKE